MAYHEMYDEFARELPNIVNLLVNTVHELDAWSTVLKPLDLAGKMKVLVEFVSGPSAFALCLPYAIKSRFAFAAAHLCHQANQVKEGASWKDDLPLDREIVLSTADKYGKAWLPYGTFKEALKKIADGEFAKATGDFRHKFSHRLSPRIEIGLTQLVTRMSKPGGGFMYGYGSTQPLPLALVVASLKDQLTAIRNALTAFDALTLEHAAAIQAKVLE